MDRCSILVDAGHLLAEGGKLCCDTKSRRSIVCEYEPLIRMLERYASAHCGLPVLRTYWYDGARDGIPTSDHLAVSRLAGVKLRLGRLSGGKQKGVDALIYRDLMTLARERAVATAYLLGGDEDLRESVSSAQDMGVRVVVLGIAAAADSNQADTLVREADEHHVYDRDDLLAYFSKVEAAPLAEPGGTDRTLTASPLQAARAFAVQWIEAASHEELQRLASSRPVVPKELDVQLLQHLEGVTGRSLRADEDARRAARAEFWSAVRAAG
jgi:hypothetical protein